MNYKTSPESGDNVKLLFNNGMVETGVVLFWSDEKSVIKSHNTDNILIVHNTLTNIIAVQICNDSPRKEPVKPTEVFVDKELTPDRYYKDERLRAKSLLELYKIKAQEERERARAALTSFEPTGEVRAPYAPKRTTIPRNWGQKPIQLDTSEENIRSY